MKNKTQGLTVRTAKDHLATTKKVLRGDMDVGGMEVALPHPKPHHRYQVQIYDVRFGRFVYHKYVSSLDEAKREMARQRALGHRVKHVRVSRASRGPDSRRPWGTTPTSRGKSGQQKTRSAKEPLPKNPELEALKADLEALRKKLGLDAGAALPNSLSKCHQLIKRLRAKLA